MVTHFVIISLVLCILNYPLMHIYTSYDFLEDSSSLFGFFSMGNMGGSLTDCVQVPHYIDTEVMMECKTGLIDIYAHNNTYQFNFDWEVSEHGNVPILDAGIDFVDSSETNYCTNAALNDTEYRCN